jgi:Uma2 family endonuclease
MPARFENPCPFHLTRDQYYHLGELGFFGKAKVELLSGEVIEQYPDDPADPSPRPFRFTREQFRRMGELGFFDGRRVELVYGELVALPPVAEAHVAAVSLTADQLKAAFGASHYVRVQAPLNMAIVDPIPDIAVVPGSPRDYLVTPTTALLIVEVADTTLAYDTTKAELYATAGVPEYWVIDLEHRQLIVFRAPQALPQGLGATACKTHLTLAPTDSVSPLATPNASILVGDLLP